MRYFDQNEEAYEFNLGFENLVSIVKDLAQKDNHPAESDTLILELKKGGVYVRTAKERIILVIDLIIKTDMDEGKKTQNFKKLSPEEWKKLTQDIRYSHVERMFGDESLIIFKAGF